MVGHLMLDGCSRDVDGNTHNDITPHARYTWFPGDWYRSDPCMSASSAPAWYAPDVLEWIRKSNVPHEIGSHSFSHILYDHPESSRDMVEADLKAAVETAARKGIMLRSFVFPRNQIGHLEILRMFGISSFRGVADPLPGGKVRSLLMKPYNFLNQFLGLAPRFIQPEEVLPGLWNLPGNHFFMPRRGIRRILPRASQARKAKQGINQAVKTGSLYHMWCHPSDLQTDSDAMFSGLEEAFSYASRMREKGLLDILTMSAYVERLERGVRPRLLSSA